MKISSVKTIAAISRLSLSDDTFAAIRTLLLSRSPSAVETPKATRTAREPLRWEAVSMERGRKEQWSVVPDGVFGLLYPDETAAYFVLEIDRGTIPITRSGGDHRSFRRKLQAYYDGWRAGRHVEQFGIEQIRVLTVTSSRERVQNMVEAVRSITGGRGSNFFLFNDRESTVLTYPLQVEWVSGRGQKVTLTD